VTLGVTLGINDTILIVVALFFAYLLLAIHYEEKRSTERRKQDLGPPDGVERRHSKGRRRDSVLHYVAWVLRSQIRRMGGSKSGKGTA
jgi:hypothetical protein